jgi:outer membrane protein assembly factor BamD (BamD/ComL family)
VTVIAALLFGLGVLISTSMTTTADGQAVVDQEKINRQLEQALKALDSGDIAAAEGYLEETVQRLPTGESKTHLQIAINALQNSNDSKSASMHVQLVQGSLQNSTG